VRSRSRSAAYGQSVRWRPWTELSTCCAGGHLRYFNLLLSLAATASQLVAQDPAYTPRTDLPTRTQVVAVYFGQSECAPCRTPELKDALHRMKPLLLAQATRSGRDFSTIGVALDWDLALGLKVLEPLAELDEIAVGANWMNAEAVRHIWQDSTAQPGLPQVLVLERTVGTGNTGIAVGPDKVLKRLVGAGAIETWVAQGAPLPPSN
jgi:hypothetical protein